MEHHRGLVRALLLLGAAVALATPQAAGAQSKALQFPLTLETEDGVVLHGELTSASNADAPVALLLHMYRSDHTAWRPLVPSLVDAGFTVLALDQRGHGRSTQRKDGSSIQAAEIPREAFGEVVRAGPEDVRAALAAIERNGMSTARVVLVGASYGCSVALLSAKDVPGLRGVVLLSPGTAYFGVDVRAAAEGLRVPLLAVAAEDDAPAATSARALASGPDAPALVYESGGHGTRLFEPRPELIARIVDFAKQASAAPAVSPAVR